MDERVLTSCFLSHDIVDIFSYSCVHSEKSKLEDITNKRHLVIDKLNRFTSFFFEVNTKMLELIL